MDWAWIIPVVALGVWVITQVIRSSEAKKQQAQRPAGRPKSSSSDIDRFLDEINRRRQQQQQQERERRDDPVTVQPVPAVLPPPPPKPLRPKPQQSRAPRPAVSAPPPIRRRPAAQPILVEAVRSVAGTEPIVVAEVLPVQPANAGRDVGFLVPTVAGVSRPKTPPHIKKLAEMLKSGHGLRMAVVLNEILGPPISKRR